MRVLRVAIALLALLPLFVHAAVTNLGTPCATSNNSSSPSVGCTVSSGTGGVVSYITIYASGGASISSIGTFGGVTPTLVGSGNELHVYRVVSPATGATTASATLSASGNWSIHVITLQGVDTADPDDATVSATVSELADLPVTVSSATSDLVIAFGTMVADNIAASNGATLSTEVESLAGAFLSSALVYEAGAASVTLGISSSATFGDDFIIAANVNAAAGGGSSGLLRRRRGN